MPSSYTSSLRLTLPATGELAGQWGTTVNTGITELVDASIAGTTTISTWGGAGVAYTLTNNNGLADEARRMVIVATGAPGEAKNVICPAVSKLYIFRNDTTGGFALTLKTPSGSGIAVPAGQHRLLYCNGTNVVEATNSTGALTATGNVSFDGGTFVFNESGADRDARFEGDTDANLLFTDASTDRVGIGTATPVSKLEVIGAVQARPAATQDAVSLAGRAGGTSGYAATITTATLAANVTHTLPAVTGTLATTGNTSQTFTGATTFSDAVTLSATTQNIALGTSQTTGTLTLGGTSQTGAITVGRATGNQTLNFGTGATLSGSTKTINLGTNGASGSTTFINLGSATTNGIFESYGSHTLRTTPSIGYVLGVYGQINNSNATGVIVTPQAISGANIITGVKSQLSANGATLSTVYHFRAQQDTWLTTTATDQYGFYVDDFSGATNNYGVYTNTASGANKWAFYANGTADSYFNGNVGVGVTAPAQKLDVLGSIQARPAATQDAVRISGRAGGTGNWGATLTTAALSADVTHTLPAVTGILATTANTTQNFSGTTSFSGAFTLSGTTSNIAIGTSQTTGTLTLGGTSQTGVITVGQSTSNQTLNFGSGAQTGTKTLNIGTGGANGSSTIINLGSSTSGATTIFESYGSHVFRPSSTTTNLVSLIGGLTGTAPNGILVTPQAVSGTSFSLTGVKSQISSVSATLTDVHHFRAQQDTWLTSTITNQYGLYVDDASGATNNYGVYTNTASGANKWAFYSNGTANSYFNGNVGFGLTAPAQKVDVIGSVQARAAATQDAVRISGRAGGTGNWVSTLTTDTLSADVTNTLPAVTGTLATTANTSQTFAGATTFSGGLTASGTLAASDAVTLSATTQNIAVGTSQTTGTVTVGGASQTGDITVGQSTGNQNLYLGFGATLSGNIKNIYFGLNGVSGSTTNIFLGSNNTGAVTNFTSTGTHNFQPGSNTERIITATGQMFNGARPTAVAALPEIRGTVTTDFSGVRTQIDAAALSCPAVFHFRAQQGTWTTATVTNQYGLYVDDASGATNNYGVFTNTASGANKWAIYANGTAASLFNGNVSVGSAGSLQVTGSGGLGYGTGSGGTQTQTTSRTNGVTLNKTNGSITLVSAAGTTAWQSFTVTNSTVAATDTVIVNQRSGTDIYQIFVTAVAAGSFRITFATTGGTTTEQPVFNFAVIKAVNA